MAIETEFMNVTVNIDARGSGVQFDPISGNADPNALEPFLDADEAVDIRFTICPAQSVDQDASSGEVLPAQACANGTTALPLSIREIDIDSEQRVLNSSSEITYLAPNQPNARPYDLYIDNISELFMTLAATDAASLSDPFLGELQDWRDDNLFLVTACIEAPFDEVGTAALNIDTSANNCQSMEVVLKRNYFNPAAASKIEYNKDAGNYWGNSVIKFGI